MRHIGLLRPGAGVLCLQPSTFCEQLHAAHRRAAAPRARRVHAGKCADPGGPAQGAGSRKRSEEWSTLIAGPGSARNSRQRATKRYGLVSSNTRGTPKRAELAFEIYGVTGGQRIEEYKGLQALKSAGGQADTGSVRSGVWKPPRISALLRSQRRLLYPAAGRDRQGGAAFTNEQFEGQLCATHIG